MNVAEILNRAADLIEPEGAWHQGYYGGPILVRGKIVGYKCLCVFGAVSQASSDEERLEAIGMRALARYLGLHHEGAVIEWNDAPNRTQAEVVAALRAAAIKAGESQ